MSKKIITAETVRAAWQAGRKVITFEPGDIVTQQARDDARQYGLAVTAAEEEPRENVAPAPVAPAPAAVPEPAPAVPPPAAPAAPGIAPEQMVASVVSQLQQALAPLTEALGAVRASMPAAMPQPSVSVQPVPVTFTPGVNPMAAPLSTDPAAPTTAVPKPVRSVAEKELSSPPDKSQADLVARVRSQVLAALPAGIAPDSAVVDELIRRTLAEMSAGAGAAAPDSGSKGDSSVTALTTNAPTAVASGLQQAGGVIHVDSRAQNWGAGNFKDSVSMLDVLTPQKGAAAAVGYLEWDSLSFSWTFERPEILVVLEGQLQLSIEGTTFTASAGDVFSIPGGVEVSLGSAGHVKCTTVGSPAV